MATSGAMAPGLLPRLHRRGGGASGRAGVVAPGDARGPGGPFLAEPAESLAAVPRAVWDGVVPGAHSALRHDYLQAWERADLAGLRSRPLVARRCEDGRPVALCPGYWYDLDLAGARFPALAGPLARARALHPRLLMARTYELGSPTPLTNPFLVEPGEDRTAAVAAMARAALTEAETGGAQFVLVQNFPCLDLPAARVLRSLGFAAVPMLPTVVVDLCYESFDAYLSAMRSAYRRRARLAFEQSASLRVEVLRRFETMSGELAGLWRLVYERATELRREVLTPAYFAAMSALEETSVLLLRRPDGSVASFALLLADGPSLAFLQCGFDAGAGRSEGAYFRLLYEIVRHGIENGFSQAELGVTTLEPKLDVGGVPVPLYALLRHRNPVSHRLITRLANGRLRPADADPRRVFKRPAPAVAELLARRGGAPS